MYATGNIDVGLYDTERVFEQELKQLNDNQQILPENRQAILDFIKEYCDGLSYQRKAKFIIRLLRFGLKLDKPFWDAKAKDINNLRKHIETAPVMMFNRKRQKWLKYKPTCSADTICDNKLILKLFYRWVEYFRNTPKRERLSGNDLRTYMRNNPFPELVRNIVSTFPKPRQYTANDMLTWEEIVKISQNTTCKRDMALIQLLGESGGRIGEILTLHLEDVEFKRMDEKTVALIHLRVSKTKIRSIGVYNCVPALQAYLKEHPFKTDKSGPLFLKYKTTKHDVESKPIRLGYDACRRIIRRAGTKAGISKKINPHHFRKSRASALARLMKEQPLKNYLGWTQDSKMLRVYSFVNEQETNEGYWASQGVKIDETGKPKINEVTPVKCGNCGQYNPCGEQLCLKCFTPLEVERPNLNELRGLIREYVGELVSEKKALPAVA